MSRARRANCLISSAVAPPRFSMKLACFSEIWALPMVLPLSPASSISWPAAFGVISLLGFLKNEPIERPNGWAFTRFERISCIVESCSSGV